MSILPTSRVNRQPSLNHAARFGLRMVDPPAVTPTLLTTPAAPANPRDSWPDWTDERWTTTTRDDAVPVSDIDPTAFCGTEPTKLGISGFTYSIEAVDVHPEIGTVGYRLDKLHTGNHYHVVRNRFGEVECSCPSYVATHEGQGTTCKHGRALVEAGMIPAPTPSRTESRLSRGEARPTSARPRRFEPSPDETAEAAQLLGDVEADRAAYRRELAAAL